MYHIVQKWIHFEKKVKQKWTESFIRLMNYENKLLSFDRKPHTLTHHLPILFLKKCLVRCGNLKKF